MQAINEFINFFKNITTEKIIDIAIAIAIIIVFFVASSFLAYGIIKIFKWKSKKKEIKDNSFYKPIKGVIIWIGIYVAILILRLPEDGMAICNKAFRIGVIIILTIGIANIFSSDSKLFKKISKHERIKGNQTLVNFISKIAKAVIYLIGVILVIADLGYDLGGIIAGLGFTGVIVALAAQDIAENLFGGLAIILDKPFVVGDWIETSKYQGSVEDITFRSTRIRTADNTVVTIQNSTLSNEPIVNYARMTSRKYSTTLNLALETNSNVIENVVEKLKFAISNTENVLKDSLSVTLGKIADDGIEIGIFFNTDIVPYNDYLGFCQKINLLILKILESENVKLSYPSQNIYIANKEETVNSNNEKV